MNRQIARLMYVSLALVGVLVVMTTYWQTWAAAGLADRQDNAIKRVAEFSVDRGLIYSWQPRKRLARNVARDVGGKTLFFRRYPQHGLAAHIVGYSTTVRSRAGLEASENDFLTGSNTNLSTVLDTTTKTGLKVGGPLAWKDSRKGYVFFQGPGEAALIRCGTRVSLGVQPTGCPTTGVAATEGRER